MPYCPECGTRYEENDPVCPTCGRNFPDIESTPEDIYSINETVLESEIPVEPSGKKSANLEEDVISAEYQPSLSEETAVDVISSLRYTGESHLGKGVIKPQAVEQSLDGYHFKYDIPQRNFIKAEPIKSKPQEYRVTNSDSEFPAKELQPAVMEAEEEPVTVQEKTDIELEPVVNEPEEIIGEVVEEEKPVEPDAVVQDIPVKEIPESVRPEPVSVMEDAEKNELEDTEVIPALILPEPEIAAEPIREIMWEGRQTWLKFPLGNVYRISNHSLIVFGRDSQKLFEVNLALITSIYLKQSWFSMLLGIGDLELKIRDFPAPQIVLEGIEAPHKVKQMLEELCKNKL